MKSKELERLGAVLVLARERLVLLAFAREEAEDAHCNAAYAFDDANDDYNDQRELEEKEE